MSKKKAPIARIPASGTSEVPIPLLRSSHLREPAQKRQRTQEDQPTVATGPTSEQTIEFNNNFAAAFTFSSSTSPRANKKAPNSLSPSPSPSPTASPEVEDTGNNKNKNNKNISPTPLLSEAPNLSPSPITGSTRSSQLSQANPISDEVRRSAAGVIGGAGDGDDDMSDE